MCLSILSMIVCFHSLLRRALRRGGGAAQPGPPGRLPGGQGWGGATWPASSPGWPSWPSSGNYLAGLAPTCGEPVYICSTASRRHTSGGRRPAAGAGRSSSARDTVPRGRLRRGKKGQGQLHGGGHRPALPRHRSYPVRPAPHRPPAPGPGSRPPPAGKGWDGMRRLSRASSKPSLRSPPAGREGRPSPGRGRKNHDARPIKVLLVDDEERCWPIWPGMLRQRGFQVPPRGYGQQALAALGADQGSTWRWWT